MRNDLNWGNSEINKRMQEASRQKTIEFSKVVDENKRRFDTEQSKRKIESSTNSPIEEQRTSGKVINRFARDFLDGKISQARWTLAIVMAVTLLFKHQWFLWIIFIITYNVYVNKLRAEVFDSDNGGLK